MKISMRNAMMLAAAIAASGRCQTFNSTQLDHQPVQGFFPTGTYAFSDIETIGVSSGNLMLHIPIASLPAGPGKMPGPSISLHYNSRAWEAVATVHRVWNCQAGYVGSYANPALESEYTTYKVAPMNNWGYAGFAYALIISHRSDSFTADEPDPNPSSCAVPDNATICADYPANQYFRNWRYQMKFPDGSLHELLWGGGARPDGYYEV